MTTEQLKRQFFTQTIHDLLAAGVRSRDVFRVARTIWRAGYDGSIH